ncbi:hypothetical protein Ahy_B03g061952 isoform B [Arachis hypogaea]|uniref:Uncharacterized protein n=1 Tax=Arachis hypogaea TaxID=3818 RepID=A0A444ZSU7_ARAHY|nr:hypothetical protein Ahy_B03g061952 isoform B [Arachis hypogaea]
MIGSRKLRISVCRRTGRMGRT